MEGSSGKGQRLRQQMNLELCIRRTGIGTQESLHFLWEYHRAGEYEADADPAKADAVCMGSIHGSGIECGVQVGVIANTIFIAAGDDALDTHASRKVVLNGEISHFCSGVRILEDTVLIQETDLDAAAGNGLGQLVTLDRDQGLAILLFHNDYLPL